jgi:biopolymer transport protein ExbB
MRSLGFSNPARLTVTLVCLLLGATAAGDVDLAEIAHRVRAAAQAEAVLHRERESDARADQQRQARLEQQAVARRDAAEAKSVELDLTWRTNEREVARLGELLAQHQSNLGELFGVTRQVAGDAANVLQQSLLSPRFAPADDEDERSEFLRRLADAASLPSIDELERLWFEMHRELTGTADVLRYRAPVARAGSLETEVREVVSIGPFTTVSGADVLGYLPGKGTFAELEGRLPAALRDAVERFQDASGGYATAVVDPARGALIGMHLARPDLMERIHHGAIVGYVIIGVGITGLLVAVFQAGYLIRARQAVSRQLRDLGRLSSCNALGRVLLALRDEHALDNPDLARLMVSEAALHEVPKLERFQAFLRLAVGAGPLLGLVGTVIGMILTFKAITASGSSDPRLMAQGIGQAMVATVLGLGIAIPLLFANAGLANLSGAIVRVLAEQGNLMLASLSARRQPTARLETSG